MTVNQVERKVLGKNSSLEFVACFEESQEALAQCSMIAKCNPGFVVAFPPIDTAMNFWLHMLTNMYNANRCALNSDNMP